MTTLEDLEKSIQVLEDMRAIERLQAKYWDTLDAKDWDGLSECLVDDFVFINNTTGGRYEGRDGMLETLKGKFTIGLRLRAKTRPYLIGRSKTTCTMP